jgi:CHAD domain-containing protein
MKQLEWIYQKRSGDFLACLHNLGRDPEPEQIHRLRVSIKKLRAVRRFLGVTAPGAFPFTNKDPFTKLFKRSGSLREIQLNKQLASAFKERSAAVNAYLHYLNELEGRAMETFKKHLNTFPEPVLLKSDKKTVAEFKHLSSEKLYRLGKNYARSELDKVLKLLKKKSTVTRTHHIRRVLKRTEPILLICRQARPGKKTRELIGKVRLLNVLLGEWHDNAVFISSLTKYLKLRKPANPGPIEKWVESSNKRGEAELEEIKIRLHEFARQA